MNFKYFKISSLVPFILALAVALQPVSRYIEDWVSRSQYPLLVQVSKYIDALSVVGMITVILTLINLIGWEWGVFKWLIDIPNLNGRYVGQLTSSYIDPATGRQVVKDCVLEIKQSASRISVFAYYGDINAGITSSQSYTTSEQFVKDNNGFFLLYYIFTNTPQILAAQLNNHDGTAKLKYYPDRKRLEGDYYNKRSNNGQILVDFTQKKLIGRLIP